MKKSNLAGLILTPLIILGMSACKDDKDSEAGVTINSGDTVEFGDFTLKFPNNKLAAFTKSLMGVGANNSIDSIREAAATLDQFDVPPKGSDIGTAESVSDLQPGDIVVGEAKAAVYLSDGLVLSGDKPVPMSIVGKISKPHQGYFRLKEK